MVVPVDTGVEVDNGFVSVVCDGDKSFTKRSVKFGSRLTISAGKGGTSRRGTDGDVQPLIPSTKSVKKLALFSGELLVLLRELDIGVLLEFIELGVGLGDLQRSVV